MKKLIFVLAICFIAVPAFAEVAVTLDYNQPNGTVTVKYSGADPCVPAEMPRAFALDITIDGPGTITGISGYKNDWVHDVNGEDETFESNSQYPGFGVYPARISWWLKPGDDACDVNSYGTPLADDTNDPGAGDGLDSNHVVLEFASLYYGVVNAPPAAGTLCVLDIDCGGEPTVEGLDLHMTDEDTYRGGLVFEDGSLGEIDANVLVCVGGCDEPIPPTTPTPVNNAVGVVAKLLPTPTYPTLSWTPAAGGVNPRYDVYFGTATTPVIVVSTDQPGLSYVATTAVQGKTYYWQIVAKNDCNPTGVAGPIWSFNTDCMNIATTPTVEYTAWVGGGALPWSKPSCWCYQRNCRGDINGTIQTPYWVYTQDLTLMKDAYGKLAAQLTGNRICADINHSIQTPYRVYTQDLTVLKSYYGKLATQTPVCTETVNFWTN